MEAVSTRDRATPHSSADDFGVGAGLAKATDFVFLNMLVSKYQLNRDKSNHLFSLLAISCQKMNDPLTKRQSSLGEPPGANPST
jgi:hypothetical protein